MGDQLKSYLEKKINILDKVKKDAAFALLIKLGSSAAGIIIGFVLARVLSADILGNYFVLLNLIRITSTVAQVGLGANLMRLLAIEYSRSEWCAIKKQLITTVSIVIVSLILIIVLYSIFWVDITSILKISSANWLEIVLIFCIVVRIIEEMQSHILKGLHKVRLGVGLIDSPRQLVMLSIILLIWLLGIKPNITTVFIIYMTATIPAVLIGFYSLNTILRDRCSSNGHSDSILLVKGSAPYFVMNILSALIAYSPLWLVSALLGNEQAGIYGVVVQLTILVSFFLGIANQVTPALLASLSYKGKFKELEKILRQTALWGLLISTPLVVLLILYGREILIFAYGSQYGLGYVALLFLSFGQLVNAASGSPGFFLQMNGDQKLLILITMFWFFFTLIASYLLAEKYGINGIAASAALSMVAHNISLVISVYKIYGIKTYAKIPSKDYLFRFFSKK